MRGAKIAIVIGIGALAVVALIFGISRIGGEDELIPMPAGYSYVASRLSPAFHVPTCRWVEAIRPDNRVFYRTVQEATDAGKKPCKGCIPSESEQASHTSPRAIVAAS